MGTLTHRIMHGRRVFAFLNLLFPPSDFRLQKLPTSEFPLPPSQFSLPISHFRIFSRGIMSRRSPDEVGSPALSDDDGSDFHIVFRWLRLLGHITRLNPLILHTAETRRSYLLIQLFNPINSTDALCTPGNTCKYFPFSKKRSVIHYSSFDPPIH